MTMSCVPSPPKIECLNGTDQLGTELGQIYDAEETIINSIVLKEEVYFPTAIVLEINFINPTTETLDFKQLDSVKYERFENYEEIDQSLKKEAERIVHIVNDKCDVTKFTSIIVIFTRRVKSANLEYSFGSHLELKYYIENHRTNINY